jgi:hypothetical protein
MRCSLQELGVGNVSHPEGEESGKKESRARPPKAVRVPRFRARAAYGKNARASNCRLVPAFSSATPTFFYSSDPDPWVERPSFCWKREHRPSFLYLLFFDLKGSRSEKAIGFGSLDQRVRFLLQGPRLFRASSLYTASKGESI